MLPEQRRHLVLDRFLIYDTHGNINQLQIGNPESRRYRGKHSERIYLFVGEYLVEFIDRSRRDTGLAHPPNPFVCRAPLRFMLENFVKFVAARNPLAVALAPGGLRQLRQIQQPAELREEAIVAGGNQNPAIRSLERLVGSRRGRRGANRPRYFAIRLISGPQE